MVAAVALVAGVVPTLLMLVASPFAVCGNHLTQANEATLLDD